MNLRKSVLSLVFAASLVLGGAVATAQDATPDVEEEATPVSFVTVEPKAIRTADGQFAGTISLWEDADGVHLVVRGASSAVLEPGEYALALSETGICDETEASEDAHGNMFDQLTVEEDGSFELWASLDDITLNEGEESSLHDEDGSAIVIYAEGDDHAQVACGVIFAPADDEPAGTPAATPES